MDQWGKTESTEVGKGLTVTPFLKLFHYVNIV
jgi:hypothetical protein